MHDYWPASHYSLLKRNARGWLEATDAYLRTFLGMPELALVDESCAAEIALHDALAAAPSMPVGAAALAALADADARDNYRTWLAFRDALLEAGTLEAWYLALMRQGNHGVPPAFVDRIVEAIVRGLFDDRTDAFEARAAEMLFRAQRLSQTDGRLLAADRETVDLLHDTAGLGDIGRLLVQNRAPMPALEMQVLTPESAAAYGAQGGGRRGARHAMLLDLTHEISNDVGHGLSFTMTRAHSGLKAFAGVLEKWVSHLLGVSVRVVPLQKVDDDAWRWHIGLDVDSMAILNDLYEARTVEPSRMQRLVSLFSLTFDDPREMRADVAGKPVYLGLATAADGTVKVKPQNLLLNLPLARSM